MTREEAITVLNMVEAHGSLVIQAKEMAIKALEQESVLDKIKAEIFNACSDNYHMPVYNLNCEQIFDIIDKYKTEIEQYNQEVKI